jgi:uncharacterized protein (DUF169 family)
VNTQQLAAIVASTWPDRPAAVGFARVDDIPDGVPAWQGPSASACQFWRAGTHQLFAAGAAHGECPVGRMTQGFPVDIAAEGGVITLMAEIGYIDPIELSHLATLPQGHTAIVYGPLDGFPVEPEAVLVFADASQLMLISEAMGSARLDGDGLALHGRPTCAAIPRAINQATLQGSLACVGARVYADLDPGEMLIVVPAARVDELVTGLERVLPANRQLEELHGGVRARVRG